MKKLLIIALLVISAVAGAVNLKKVNKDQVKSTIIPPQEVVHGKSSVVATWD